MQKVECYQIFVLALFGGLQSSVDPILSEITSHAEGLTLAAEVELVDVHARCQRDRILLIQI
jgi:hypothetical protein